MKTEAELRALLPAPETLLAYASAMTKPYRDIEGGVHQPSEISIACANALRLAAISKPANEAATLELIATKAREWAGHYSSGSDGRNTFVLFAEWIESFPNFKAAPRACP
jgi:hypothetical protein